MSKKIVAMLMAVAMAFSLLPVTAFAADETQEGNSQPVTASDKNLTMNKTVKPNGDGTYTVCLESYAKGEVTTTTTTKQMDIVLLLDVSGSMGYQFTQDIEEYQPVYKNSLDTNKTYLIKQGWWYEEVTYCQKCKKWTRGCHDGWLTGNHKGGKVFTPTEAENDTDSKHTQFYQYVYISGKSKMDALKTAVNQFIEGIAENSPQSNISIVKFAGEKTDKIGNNTNKSGKNYTQIVKELTKVDNAERVNQLKNAVSQLQASGSTASDYGLEKAQEALKSANQAKVVVLFTDGEPNHSSGFDYEVATKAVNTAKILKDKSTTIYTVGVFQNPSNDVHTYMSSVSSNYPNATAKYEEGGWGKDDTWTVTDGGSTPGTYYKTADSADELINAFKTISSQVSSTNLDGSAVVVDKVPSNFKAPTNKKDVTLKVANYKADGTFDTGTDAPDTIHASVNEDGTVSVTGFNFSENWCGLDENNQARGQKLIIEFTISRTNYGGTQPTNAGAYIKAGKEANEEPIISLKDPQVPVTIELNKTLGVNDKKPYDGKGFAILTKIAAQANTLVDGLNNAYVDMALTVTVNNNIYTYKIPAGETTGSWYQGDSTSPMSDGAIGDIKTSKDVKRGTNNEAEAYTCNFDLTLSDDTPRGAAPAEYKNNTASFKITPRDVTVKANDQQVQKGTDPNSIPYTATVNGLVNGEQESLISRDIKCDDYTVNTAAESELEITASGAKEQGNYTVTYQPGKLTVTAAPVTTGTLKVTKEVQGENLTLDKLPSDFKITVAGTGENKELSLKDSGVNVNESKTEATWTISDLPTGTYTVSEENADVNGYDCTATYSATNGATVIVNNANTASANTAQNQPATDAQASQKVTVTENQTSTMTVTNKYTKQEVVPPTPADPVKLDVSRSKTAKPLDTSTWTSNVTLSLPSAEYEPVIDVVFILDDTYAGNGIFKDAATALLNELSEKKNLDVNVGIVNFDAVARDWVAATTNSQYSGLVSLKNTEGLTALQNAIATKLDKNNDGQTKKIGATNIEWPLEMAQNMLASGKGTEKYAILFSDMYGYVYRGDLIIDGQTYENVPLSKRLYAGESKFYQGSLSMGTKYQSFADVYAHRNDEENQTTDGFFRDSSWDSYWSIYSGHMQIPTNPATKDSPDPFGVPGGYSGFEKSTCLVYDRLLQMKQAGINISIVNNDFAPGDIREVGHVQSIKNDMLDTLEQKGISVIKTQKNVTAEDMTNVFDTLKDQLIQVVSAGSTVTDKIGTNFDFVGLNTMSLKIGDNTIPGVIDEATNTITFKHGGKDNAHVVVYDSSADSFTWTINEDVTKDARVQLTYSVKLTKPETAAGTYGVTDLNGDEKVDDTGADVDKTKALYTNQEAKLVPKDSNGNTGEELTFPKPSVFYTVSSGSSGSHSGGSRPSLNTKDHYGYIIGYPVDYYTGQPTTDQTKKPVRPEGKITRAEVATIYFRMLTDESRTKFWSQSSGYSDVKTGDWFNNAVSTLSNAGIIAGYEDGSFRPNGYITRAEFATIAARFFDVSYNGKDLFPDISGHWAKDYINQAANKGFVNGYEDGTFKPDRNITRAEAVTLVNRTLDRHPDKSHFTKDMLVWPDNMDQTKWYYADMQEATNSHTYQMKENSDKTKYENWTKTLPIRNWEALEKVWSNANSSQGNGNVV